MSYLGNNEVLIIHFCVVSKSYQKKSKVLYIFVPSKLFGQLIDISLKNFVFLRTFDSEFSNIAVEISDQYSRPQKIEDKTNVTLVIN